ncbi:cytochrome P450 4c3 [Trichonephila clavata]|uniref:Cytochrome P450 4c3 n=1 Tax=Trichonephila clavata TaxID=2740835 RepID=A0A8X6KED3_TRICU|nr:cytochrome P450 4c3 [Trichonephila clavata]
MDQKKLQYLNGNKDESKGKKKALIDVLLQQHFENQVLRDEDIREDIDVLIIGGHETTATIVAWTLYLLGLYPDIQKQVHEELDKVFGKDGERYASERDLNDLKYLDSVLKETQRLYPAATFWARQVSEDINICGYTLPKGSSFVLPAMILHRDPEVFPEPDKFDPDRFSAENSVKIPEYAYIPFSVGQRNCIGQRFGVLEMKTIVSTILRSYRVESLDGRDVVLPVMQGFLRSNVPIRVRVRPRRNQ